MILVSKLYEPFSVFCLCVFEYTHLSVVGEVEELEALRIRCRWKLTSTRRIIMAAPNYPLQGPLHQKSSCSSL